MNPAAALSRSSCPRVLRWCDSPEAFVVFFLCGFITKIHAHWSVIAGLLEAPFAFVDLTAQGALLQRLIEIEVIDALAAIAIPSA